MKRIRFVGISLLLITSLFAQDQLIKDSDKQIINKDDIQNKSKSFYRYARNEIFARQGYVFKDQDLSLFFTNTSWYKPNVDTNINLNEVEKANAATLKTLEDFTAVDPYEILYKFDFNNSPLFYIGDRLNKYAIVKAWYSGRFIHLDNAYKWTMNCPSIPVEFLIVNAKSDIRVGDEGSLKSDQILFEDIDEGYNNNLGTEIKIKIFGPSDDSEYIYFGFDNNKKFKKLFSIPSHNIEQSKISDTKIRFETRIRMDLQGTSFHPQTYLFDTIEKECYKIPELFVKPWSNRDFKNTKDLPLYYDARSAVKRERLAEIDTLKSGTAVIFINFYRVEGNGSAQIEFTLNNEKIIGWLNQDDVGPHTFTGMVNAD